MAKPIADQWNLISQNDDCGVINYTMIVNLIGQQAAQSEAGRLHQEDGIKLDEITEIRIEFLRIQNIDHLWPLTNIAKLSLSHNSIRKIENLDALVKLNELDLSFNSISVMENLNHLVKLEILLLTGNRISVIEKIDNLAKLTIFSIADNIIEEWEHVVYLRKLKNLRSVNITGNPCTRKENYDDYFVALLPQVIYFCYVLINEEKRATAAEKYRRAIVKVEDDELKIQNDMDEKKALELKTIIDTKSYVDNMDGDDFFHLLFLHDTEGVTLSNINDETLAAFEEYRINLTNICHELYEFGINENCQRKKEHEIFLGVIQAAQDSVRDDARQIIQTIVEHIDESFTKFNSEIDEIQNLEEDIQETDTQIDMKIVKVQSYTEEIEEYLSTQWTKLLHSEVVLYEQIEDIIQTFKINMGDMKDSFVEFTRGTFARMRNIIFQYRDAISGIVGFYISNIGEESWLPSYLLNICGDVDILSNSLAASQDVQLQVINGTEDNIIQRINTWFNDLIDQLNKQERTKHRRRILEISHFLQYQREEMRNHFFVNDPLAMDVAAALED